MTALQRNAPTLLGAAALIVTGSFAPEFADAQVGGSGRMAPLNRYQQTAESRVLLLTTVHAPDKRTALEGTKTLYEQIKAKIQAKELFVLASETINPPLLASGYPTDEPLNPIDAKNLGGPLRADEFLDATFGPAAGGKGWQYTGKLYLLRDIALYEILPTPAPGDPRRVAADALVESLKEVRKQLAHEQICHNNLLQRKLPEAETAARAGVAAYPKGTIARTCLMRAVALQKKGPDATLAIAREILAVDSLHKYALQHAVDAFREKNDTANYVTYAVRLVGVDLGNAEMVEGVVTSLAEMRQADVALKTVEKAIESNPLETPLQRIRILLEIGGSHWKAAAAHSEELAKIDTAAVDSAFFVRLSVAYRNDSQPAKALEAIERATKKFPNNAFFRVLLGQEYARNGDHAKAVAEYKKALEIDTKLARIRIFIASGFQQMNEGDSTIAWLRKAWEAKEDTTTIAGIALVIARPLLTAAQASKLQADYEKVIPIIAFADSVAAKDDNKWLMAYAAYGIWGPAIQALQGSAPMCDSARAAVKYIELSTTKIREGGHRAGGENAMTIMNNTGAAMEYAQGQVTRLCRSQ